MLSTFSEVATLPRSIYIEPTSRCNELCQQCPRTLLSREDDRDLSFDQFRYIVDQFPVLERVVLHGLGEPLLNKDLSRMIQYLKARGTYVLFNSNGILLNEKRGQALIDAGLDECRLSMDGATRETYARVRGVDVFDKIWRNMRAFTALQEAQHASKPAVSLWFTAMKENLHELPGLIDLASRMAYARCICNALSTLSKVLPTLSRPCFAVQHARNWSWCAAANKPARSAASPLALRVRRHRWKAWFGILGSVPGRAAADPIR